MAGLKEELLDVEPRAEALWSAETLHDALETIGEIGDPDERKAAGFLNKRVIETIFELLKPKRPEVTIEDL